MRKSGQDITVFVFLVDIMKQDMTLDMFGQQSYFTRQNSWTSLSGYTEELGQMFLNQELHIG